MQEKDGGGRNKFRKVLLALADRMEESNKQISKLEEEKQSQLLTLSGELLRLQGSLLREKQRVITMVLEKDRIIDNQRKDIEKLRQQNKLLEVKARQQQQQQHVIDQPKLNPPFPGFPATSFPHLSSGLPRFPRGSDFSRSADDLDKSAKPPVPSRDGVNRKLQIGGGGGGGGPPPPPPPRGVSLKGHPSEVNCDILKSVGCKLDKVDKHIKLKDGYHHSDKHEDKFDSGRESDETFDSESVQSESTDLSASPQPESTDLSTSPNIKSTNLSASPNLRSANLSTSPDRQANELKFMEEKVMKIDNKTKVTFWTDTYL